MDAEELHARLALLARQGLLKVRCPEDAEAVSQMVSLYDGKGDGKLEHDEWSAMIHDVVAHKGDWEGCALRKTVDYLAEAKDEIGEVRECLEAMQRRRGEQLAELARLTRLRYPNGLPTASDAEGQ